MKSVNLSCVSCVIHIRTILKTKLSSSGRGGGGPVDEREVPWREAAERVRGPVGTTDAELVPRARPEPPSPSTGSAFVRKTYASLRRGGGGSVPFSGYSSPSTTYAGSGPSADRDP